MNNFLNVSDSYVLFNENKNGEAYINEIPQGGSNLNLRRDLENLDQYFFSYKHLLILKGNVVEMKGRREKREGENTNASIHGS